MYIDALQIGMQKMAEWGRVGMETVLADSDGEIFSVWSLTLGLIFI